MLSPRARRLLVAASLGLTMLGASACTPAADTDRAAPASTSVVPVSAPPKYPTTPISADFGPYPVPQPQRLVYAVPGGIADPAQNYGDLYLPTLRAQDPTADVPVVVLLHGGGWRTPSAATSVSEMARSLVSHGVAVWNVEYRRIGAGGGYPVTLTDTAAAIDYLQTIKAQLAPSLDLKNVVVAGHSAGGQLAVWAAARPMLTPGAMGSVPAVVPAAVVSMAGVLDMRRAVADGNVNTRLFLGLPDEFPQQFKVADPIQNINPEIPVTCFNGTSDRVVHYESCVSFIAALKAKGGQGRDVILPAASHNIYLPSQAQNRYWPVVQRAILGYADQLKAVSKGGAGDSGGR